MPERPKGADCKSAGVVLRRFESFPAHHVLTATPSVAAVSARLNSLILCDFAQVREGLLFIQSGGLTRLVAPTFPAKFACRVACLVYLPPDEADVAHEMVIKVKSAATASSVATVKVELHGTPVPTGLQPGEGRQIPIVVPLDSVVFPTPGEYDLQAEVDEEFAGDLSFRVGQRVTPAGG